MALKDTKDVLVGDCFRILNGHTPASVNSCLICINRKIPGQGSKSLTCLKKQSQFLNHFPGLSQLISPKSMNEGEAGSP